MSKLHYILPCCLLLLSIQACYTQRKAETQIRKADVTYPITTATFCASRFPVVPRTNTVIERTTDTLYQQGDTVVMGDTVYITRTQTITHNTQTTIHDTIPDVAKINALQGEISVLKSDVTLWQDRAVKAQDKADNRAKWVWMFWGLVAILVGFGVFKAIIKLKTINVK
jgi:hypothetical protein